MTQYDAKKLTALMDAKLANQTMRVIHDRLYHASSMTIIFVAYSLTLDIHTQSAVLTIAVTVGSLVPCFL